MRTIQPQGRFAESETALAREFAEVNRKMLIFRDSEVGPFFSD